jgi:integrase
MIAIKPEYIPIKSVLFDDPLVTLNFNGEVCSRFSDALWNFRHYIHNKNVANSRALINFDVKLSDGSNLLDKKNSSLLLSAKQYLYTRFNILNPRSGKVLGPQSLIGHFYCIITFINYLISQKKYKFSLFKQDDTSRFQGYIFERNPKLATNTHAKYLCTILDLYHFRDVLPDGLAEHPWPDSSVVHLSNDRKNNGRKNLRQTPCIPDYLCSQLFSKSVKFLEDNSHRIIKSFSLLQKSALKIARKELKNEKQTNDIKTTRPDKLALYHAKRSREYIKYKNRVLKRYKFSSKIELTKFMHKARACCYVIISLTTGMRNSEIASLDFSSFIKSEGWDGEEYFWLEGLTYKLVEEPTEAKWMVPEIVRIAIDHLASVNFPLIDVIRFSLPYLNDIDKENQNNLIPFLFKGNDFKTNLLNGVSNDHWNKTLKLLSKEFDLCITDHNNDLKLPPGSIWPLATHHFRRTFACLAARSSLGDLRYLREHYKHWSLDMTLYYANTDVFDDSLFDEVLTERNDLQSALVSDWIVKDAPLAGGRGEAIATFRQRGMLKKSKDIPNLVKQISDSVFVRGTGHSWCLASGDGCGGEGLYDELLCPDCDSSVIDKSHLPVWKGLKEQHEFLLNMPDSGVGTKERAREYIKKSDELIDKLSN